MDIMEIINSFLSEKHRHTPNPLFACGICRDEVLVMAKEDDQWGYFYSCPTCGFQWFMFRSYNKGTDPAYPHCFSFEKESPAKLFYQPPTE